MNIEELNKSIDALKVGERLILDGVPDTLYHASKGIGSTLMREAVKSPAHYHYAKTAPHSDTPERMIGTATHTLVLEPEKFGERVIQLPEGIVRGVSKKYKEFAELHPDKIHLKAEELQLVSDYHAAIINRALPYFQNGTPEKSYWFKHESGLVLKARVDYQFGDAGIDLKTTRKEDSAGFKRSVKYDYGIQDALYKLVTQLADILYIGVCKTPPHDVYMVRQGDDVRSYNERLINDALTKLAFSYDLNNFEFEPLTIETTELTNWEKENL